ncbi:MAG: chemotaxis response regulator protein-glutamate methylesterase [Ignavibacteria bacterium]|nr:chemotaxis response regulator protein-glutamate methylesterase [Ignavibacteria bacterium]
MKKIKVLIVDDSAIVRQTLSELLSSDLEIEVIATAADPYIAVNKMKTQVPDVITLDVEMPKMDGITFLKKIMTHHPVPVVICSSLTGNESETALKALEYGAVEIITKPKMGTKQFLEESKIHICEVVKAASKVDVKKYNNLKSAATLPISSEQEVVNDTAMLQTTEKVVVVGASTGGIEALRVFLEAFSHDAPGIVIAQHMPENFVKPLVMRLSRTCKISIKEAENNDSILRGQVLIAPGNKHILVKRSGARYYVEVKEGPLVNRHRPSVDILFRSAARYAGKNSIGVILTGNGDDGARGMLDMKNAGAYNIAQDEASSVVFGMPSEAIKLNAVNIVLSLQQIAEEVLKKSE